MTIENTKSISRFDTVLVANRGEIALRVFRTARAMGLRTVAVYSEPDAELPHARAADAAVRIGPASAAQSYLDIGKLIDAAKRTGAQAVHPGYGFLSESEDFASACEKAGLVFIGPSPHAIRAMGNKVMAKQIALKSGLPCIPGYDGADQDEAVLAREAARIGFPLMVKAVAGGGGKGMRLVQSSAQIAEAVRAARSEGLKSFGSGALMLERAITRARHVEVQVFGDRHGNYIYLGDRDCSIQRRHQKVVEEAPAPGLTDVLRRRMGSAAVAAARAVNYEGAGTVEFLVTPDEEFYFLEMNTRLQVEHPVTEMVTGLDLVEWQIRIARGELLPLTQEHLRLNGHAIEVRVYAEDPAAQFLPQSGEITLWQPPEGPGIRVDTGFAEGSRVSTYYDPMIAKVIAHGADRDLARVRLARSLERFTLGGLRNNLFFLKQCILHPVFAAGQFNTGFLDREKLDVEACVRPDRQLIAIAALLFQSRAVQDIDPELRNWHSRPWRAQPLALRSGDWRGTVLVETRGKTTRVGDPQGETEVSVAEEAGDRLLAVVDGVSMALRFAWCGQALDLARGELCFRFEEVRGAAEGAAVSGKATLLAPMPGSIVEVRVVEGSKVRSGEVLLILEAMKMEHQIQAPVAGRVTLVEATAGQQVGMRQRLIEIDPEEATPEGAH